MRYVLAVVSWFAVWHASARVSDRVFLPLVRSEAGLSVLGWIAGIGMLVFPFVTASIAAAIIVKIASMMDAEQARREAAREAARKAEEDAERQRRIAEEATRARTAALVAGEARRRGRAPPLARSSVEAFESLPQLLVRAEQEFDAAETAMDERAFAPFWEAVERGAGCLGSFDSAIQTIRKNAAEYRELSKGLAGARSSFPISAESIDAMAASSRTAGRMHVVVGMGQRDFQFATIYEQRRTNQILIAGFSTLGAALQGLGHRLELSIQEVRNSIDEMSDSVVEAVREVGHDIDARVEWTVEAVSDQSRILSESISSDTAVLAERCDTVVEILDDIRHGRRR